MNIFAAIEFKRKQKSQRKSINFFSVRLNLNFFLTLRSNYDCKFSWGTSAIRNYFSSVFCSRQM